MRAPTTAALIGVALLAGVASQAGSASAQAFGNYLMFRGQVLPRVPQSGGGCPAGQILVHMDGGAFTTCSTPANAENAKHWPAINLPAGSDGAPLHGVGLLSPVGKANFYWRQCGNAAGC